MRKVRLNIPPQKNKAASHFMPIFFQPRHILILSLCFNVLYGAFTKSISFLHLMLMRASDSTALVIPNTELAYVLVDASMYSLTLAALMMLSLKRTQLVFTDDKFSFTAMDISHRPLHNLIRYAQFGLLFCALRFIGILLLSLPFASLQILAEHHVIDFKLLRSIPNIVLGNPAISFLIEFSITCFALHVLLGRKYLSKRLCLVHSVA